MGVLTPCVIVVSADRTSRREAQTIVVSGFSRAGNRRQPIRARPSTTCLASWRYEGGERPATEFRATRSSSIHRTAAWRHQPAALAAPLLLQAAQQSEGAEGVGSTPVTPDAEGQQHDLARRLHCCSAVLGRVLRCGTRPAHHHRGRQLQRPTGARTVSARGQYG